MGGYRTNNSIQGANPQGIVVWDGNSLMRGNLSLQDHMAAYLVDYAIAPAPAQGTNQIHTVQVAWNLQAIATSSSLTKCKRI
jgi:hypothetical protein